MPIVRFPVLCNAGRGVCDLGESGGWYTCDSSEAIYYVAPHSSEDVSAEGSLVSYKEGSVGPVRLNYCVRRV